MERKNKIDVKEMKNHVAGEIRSKEGKQGVNMM